MKEAWEGDALIRDVLGPILVPLAFWCAVQVQINNPEDLEALMDLDWHCYLHEQRSGSRDKIYFETFFPMQFVVRPGVDDVIDVFFDGMRKKMPSGYVVWDSRGNAGNDATSAHINDRMLG
jgi:hypothetical protein